MGKRSLLVSLIATSLIFNLSFGFQALKTAIPFLTHTQPVKATYDEQKETLLKLIEQTVMLHRYWEHYQVNTTIKALDVCREKKQVFVQNDTIELKKTTLIALEKEIARALAMLNPATCLDARSFETLIVRANAQLKKCARPSHLERHWLGYTLGAIGVGIAAYQCHKFMNDHATLHIPLENHDSKVIFDYLEENLAPKTSSQLTQTCTNNTATFLTSKAHIPEISKKLAAKGISINQLNFRSFKFSDFLYYMYNRQGNTYFYTVYDQCFKTPVRNVKRLIEMGPEKRALNKIDFETMMLHNKDEKIQLLTNAFAAYQEGDTSFETLFAGIDNASTFKTFTTEQLNSIVYKMVDVNIMLDEAKAALKNFGATEVYPRITPAFIKTFHRGPTPQPFSTHGIEASFIQSKDLSLQAQDAVQTVAEGKFFIKAGLEVAKLIPAAAMLYMAQKCVSDCFGWHHHRTVIQPLVKDLKDLYHFLDINKHTIADQEYVQGMLLFWTEKLSAYIPQIHENGRVYLKRSIEKLCLSTTIEHRMDIVEALLNNEVKHF